MILLTRKHNTHGFNLALSCQNVCRQRSQTESVMKLRPYPANHQIVAPPFKSRQRFRKCLSSLIILRRFQAVLYRFLSLKHCVRKRFHVQGIARCKRTFQKIPALAHPCSTHCRFDVGTRHCKFRIKLQKLISRVLTSQVNGIQRCSVKNHIAKLSVPGLKQYTLCLPRRLPHFLRQILKPVFHHCSPNCPDRYRALFNVNIFRFCAVTAGLHRSFQVAVIIRI